MSLSRQTTIVPGRDVELRSSDSTRDRFGSLGSPIAPIVSISEASSEGTTAVRTTGEPNCTSRVLQNFSTVRERNTKRKGSRFLDPWREEDFEHAQTLENTRKWIDSTSSGRNKVKGIASALLRGNRPPDDDLFRLAIHFFPPRGEIQIQVLDFCDGYTNRYDAALRDLGHCKNAQKPSVMI